MYFTINNTPQARNNRKFILGFKSQEQKDAESYIKNGETFDELKAQGYSEKVLVQAARSVQVEAERLSRDDGYWAGKDMDNNIPIGKDAVQAEKAKNGKEPESNSDWCKRYVDHLNS